MSELLLPHGRGEIYNEARCGMCQQYKPNNRHNFVIIDQYMLCHNCVCRAAKILARKQHGLLRLDISEADKI